MDSCILIDLIQLDRLDLIKKIWDGKLLVSSSIINKELAGYSKKNLDLKLEEFPINTEEQYLFLLELQKNFPGLSISDCEAILIAKVTGNVCATNDLEARKVCKKYYVDFIGLIGILELNIKFGHLDFPKSLLILENAIKNGCYISGELIKNFKEKNS